MESYTLELKSEIIDRNGNKILDLTERTYSPTNDVPLILIMEIPNDIEMRSDILAYKFHGDESNFDTLLKFNEVSNPFSIQEGLLFQIPEKTKLKANFSEKNKLYPNNDTINKDESSLTKGMVNISLSDIRSQYINSSKSTSQIPEYTNSLPPNMSKKDVTEVKVLRDGSMEVGIFNN